jgi:uncharacterized ferritin-like protein (DUF455 family)
MFRRCFERRGGRIGEYPVLNFQYRITTHIHSLVGRLAVQNRSFEAAGIDAIQDAIRNTRESGERDLVELFDTQLADEVQHVRYANAWIPKLAEREGPRGTFDVARAVTQASEAFRVVVGEAVVRYPVAEEIRREAGFNDAEIQVVKEFPSSV